MGIESDQLVYDYLSRVGDVAQQRQLPSGERMRLVSELRGEIEKQRGKFGGDSPAAVRRILGRLGTPDQVVGAATGEPVPAAAPEPPSLPKQRGTLGGFLKERRDGPSLPKQTRGPVAPVEPAASPPHLAPMHELGTSGGEPDWWRVDPGPMGATGVSGFVGGVEIPEILKPPPTPEELAEKEEAAAEAEADEAPDAPEPPQRRRLLPRLRRPAEKPPRPGLGLTNPFLLLAAVLLIVGAVLTSWLVLALGWALAYTSRRLSRTEAKLAVFGLPIASAVAGGVWIWGRTTERWGEAIPEGATGEAISATWPTVLQAAAISSALFLIWRSRRV
ncbi:hypothetical protein [Streptomyces sp. NBC_01716]|uniref:hypothetical protein n=1 Tax=Streptomyces sp. NBC_01716 TaxID=2975917 RepID=UPI002E2F4CFA|nr:hypothetical protein [Streptomyces sp. NBC_01716]